MKEREIDLLEAISQDETATQANLATELGMAVGSVNWYIKRLIRRGYLKATRMDRTRLRYNMTSEGLEVLRRRATQYMKDSLKIYHSLRQQSKDLIAELRTKGIESVYADEADPELEIFRLTCLEVQFSLDEKPERWMVRPADGSYRLEQKQRTAK
jgi:DNA-binding MarR family transcriptional regulator